MNQAIVFSIIRHVLTGAGSVLAAYGYFDAAAVEGAVGAILTLVGLVLAVLDKKRPQVQ